MFIKKILYVLLLFLIVNPAWASLDEFPFSQSPILSKAINSAILKSGNDKFLEKNLREFQVFSIRKNRDYNSSYLNSSAGFIPPSFPKNQSLEKDKYVSIIVSGLYFNALKNDKVVNLQKEKNSIYKEIFDISKSLPCKRGMARITNDYMDAQVMLLEYQKDKKLCIRQLENFIDNNFDMASLEKFDSFDIKTPVERMLSQNFKDNSEKEGLLYKLRCDYSKYKILDEKIAKKEQQIYKEEYFVQLQEELDLIELKKRQANLKLACLLDYVSLMNY